MQLVHLALAFTCVFIQAIANVPIQSLQLKNSIFSVPSESLAYYADNNTFLEKIFATFPLLYVDWDSTFRKGLANVWNQAAYYNRNSTNTSIRRVEFGIMLNRHSAAFLPLDEIKFSNQIFSRTVSSILFDLRYTENSSFVKNIYDSFLPFNMTFGAIFIRSSDCLVGCINGDRFSVALDFIYVEIAGETIVDKCFKIAKTSATACTYKQVSANVIFDNDGIRFSFVYGRSSSSFNFPIHYDLRILHEDDADSCGLKNNQQQKHIAKPIFEPELFGFSVFFDDLNSTHNPISELFAISPKLILENKIPFNSPVNLNIEALLMTIAQKARKRGHFINKNIAIKLNFDQVPRSFNSLPRHRVYTNITQQAWNASITVNQVYPGFVRSIFLQIYDAPIVYTCRGGLYCRVGLSAEKDDFNRMKLSLRPNSEEVKLPKLGVAYKPHQTLGLGQLHGKPDIVLLEYDYYFQHNCFYKDRFKDKIGTFIKRCTEKIKTQLGENTTISLYFNMLCDIPTDDTTYLDHQRKLIATLNRVSENRETMVYVNNAFRYQENPPYGTKKICGWWNFSAPAKPNGSYRIEDRTDVANRVFGFTSQNYTKTIKSETQKISLWWIMLPAVVFLGAVGLLCRLVLKYRAKCRLKIKKIEDFFHGDQNNQDQQEGTRMALCFKYDKAKYEIPESACFIDKTKCLGSGEFGIVYAGVIKTPNEETIVAVKTTKYIDKLELASAGCTAALWGLMGEVKILAYMGRHQNVVSLIGANTSKLEKGDLLVFLEYCENGSLLRYLPSLDRSYGETGLGLTLSKQFLTWAIEIADGMEYLASKKIVHADLASRNILLDVQKTAKISDFGLSRRLYEYSQYDKTKQEPMPWRWMAPESLTRLEFSEKSDVWAYGVTLWEIYSLADTPYAGLSWTSNFVSQLDAGLKLSSPKYNDNNMFTIMTKCWSRYPFERPQFSDIKCLLPCRSIFENDAHSEYNEVVPLDL